MDLYVYTPVMLRYTGPFLVSHDMARFVKRNKWPGINKMGPFLEVFILWRWDPFTLWDPFCIIFYLKHLFLESVQWARRRVYGTPSDMAYRGRLRLGWPAGIRPAGINLLI